MNWRSLAQLVRLPNLPSALADIALAALAVGALPERWPAFLLLLLSSACLYMSGMVFNDYFDIEQDRHERPDRPIASNAISQRQALALGVLLMSAGVGLAFVAGLMSPLGVWPTLVALLLAGTILAYDGWMKRTSLGPIVMGTCRFLNVLLGASLVGWPTWLPLHLGLIVGLYIVGVTWFARTEAQTSSRGSLMGASFVLLIALLLALPLPEHLASERSASPVFVYLLVALGFFVGLPASRAIRDPSPIRVQNGVKRALMGLILLDTVLATATAGTVGLVLLVLMVPSVYLNSRRWLYAT